MWAITTCGCFEFGFWYLAASNGFRKIIYQELNYIIIKCEIKFLRFYEVMSVFKKKKEDK